MIFLSIFLFLGLILAGFWIFRLNSEINRLHGIFGPLEEEKSLLDQKLSLKTQEFIEMSEKVDKFLKLFEQNEANLEKKNFSLQKEIQDLLEKQAGLVKAARIDAVATSKAVTKGLVSEEICPFLDGFPYEFKDLRMLNHPIDFICFPGMSKNKIEKVVILEIKSGAAQLTERQRQIRDCIKNNQVFWDTFRIPEKVVVESI